MKSNSKPKRRLKVEIWKRESGNEKKLEEEENR